LTDATVNEQVSRRVLSYVAPVLDQATRASGRVSVEIEEAAFPIGGDPTRHADVKGKVVFQDVEFAPGPLTRDLVALVAPAKQPGTLRLAEPVLLTIADGRVNQRGLAIPIGDVTRVEVEGWVDFDKNLGLVATLPVTPAMFGNSPLLGTIVTGTQIRVPIRGTLDAPKLDKEAFKAGLTELGKGLLVRGAGAGALEILERLSRPRDPNAPPPPTPAERKAQRLERRNERRRARGLDPLPGPEGRP
jgi:translocation and assembly module TamB